MGRETQSNCMFWFKNSCLFDCWFELHSIPNMCTTNGFWFLSLSLSSLLIQQIYISSFKYKHFKYLFARTLTLSQHLLVEVYHLMRLNNWVWIYFLWSFALIWLKIQNHFFIFNSIRNSFLDSLLKIIFLAFDKNLWYIINKIFQDHSFYKDQPLIRGPIYYFRFAVFIRFIVFVFVCVWSLGVISLFHCSLNVCDWFLTRYFARKEILTIYGHWCAVSFLIGLAN